MYKNIILIPYRNREEHLKYFIDNTVPLIKEIMSDTKVIVVEQTEGKLFNRGKVLNVGFKEYMDKTEYFITHDVDINPTQKCLESYYNLQPDNNNIIGIYTSACNTLGGIIKLTNTCINQINGFPNNFWGWGIEDKALQNRALFYKIKKEVKLLNNKKHPEYYHIFNNINDRVKNNKTFYKYTHEQYNLFNNKSNEEKKKEILSSGLNTIEYKIIERKQLHDIVELIKVEI